MGIEGNCDLRGAYIQDSTPIIDGDNLYTERPANPLPTLLKLINFDSFANGDPVIGANGFDAAVNSGGTTSLASNARSTSPPNSAAFTIAQSDEDWGSDIVLDIGQDGGDGTLQDGDEFWIQFKIFHPSTWDNSTGGDGGTKFFRFFTETPGQVPLAASTFQLRGGATINGFRTEKEGSVPDDVDITLPQFGGFALNQNNKFEFYGRFSDTTGILRSWCNNQLCGELLNENTAGGIANIRFLRLRLLNFWNNGAPATQTCWVDDFYIASSKLESPTNTDGNGNVFIGDA